MKIVLARVLDHRRSVEAAKAASEKRSMIGSGDRSERVRTYNFPQNRLTDHRINLTLYTLDRIIAGDLNPVLDALYRQDTDSRIQKEMESTGKG